MESVLNLYYILDKTNLTGTMMATVIKNESMMFKFNISKIMSLIYLTIGRNELDYAVAMRIANTLIGECIHEMEYVSNIGPIPLLSENERRIADEMKSEVNRLLLSTVTIPVNFTGSDFTHFISGSKLILILIYKVARNVD